MTQDHQALAALRRLIANDAHACTFQSFGQYRTALLEHIDKLAALAQQEAAEPAGFHDKDQPEGIAWCPGYPDKLQDITPLYTTPPAPQHAGAAEPVGSVVWSITGRPVFASLNPEWFASLRHSKSPVPLYTTPTPAAQGLTDAQIDTLLHEIDRIAREYDVHEYGLPLGIDDDAYSAPQAAMIAAVRAALATTEQAPAPSIALPIDQSIAIRAERGDRAEQAPAALTWPVMPPSKGQSPVLFEDGYAEGWAKCDSQYRALLAAAPSVPEQAEQPAVAGPVARALEASYLNATLATPTAPAQQAEQPAVDVGQMEYRGNSVAYIYQKLTAYRSAIDKAWDAMRAAGFPPDGKTALADAITAAIAAAPSVPEQAEQPAVADERAMLCANCGKHLEQAEGCISDYPEEGEWFCSQACYDQHSDLGCPHEKHSGYRHPHEAERLIACEAALRSLACWLGVGGYNADTVDASTFEAKIRDGVEHLLAAAAPSVPEQAEQPAVVEGRAAYALRLLVAAGHITQERADESLALAEKYAIPTAPAQPPSAASSGGMGASSGGAPGNSGGMGAQPPSAQGQEALEELRRAICAVGIVGTIDGHAVIRRESVIDLIDRRIAALSGAQGGGV